LFSIAAALVAGAILMLISGNNPFDIFRRIFESAFGSAETLGGSIQAATPLLFTGLAAAAAFRMGVFNIGGEGQLFMGAVAASAVGLRFGDLGAAVIPLMIAAGALAGALWASIPGLLRAYLNTSEVLSSLMLNYVASFFMSYLIFNSESYWRLLEGSGKVFPQGRPLDPSTEWSFTHIGPVDIPFGFWLGVGTAVFLWVLYRRTRFGFEVGIIADSPRAAQYAGMRTKRKILSVMAISGAVAGIGGASDVGDFRHLLDPKGLGQAGYGYSGIVVAALARFNPLAVIIVSVMMGGIDNAGRSLQGATFPAGLVGTLKGLLLFFALGGELMARYRVRVNRRVR
jgi:simple sugar transport system permease protein